jgi:hypothetical protein
MRSAKSRARGGELDGSSDRQQTDAPANILRRPRELDVRTPVMYRRSFGSAFEGAAESRTTQEGALEDQKAQDGNERGDQHRCEEDAELRLRLDRRQPH